MTLASVAFVLLLLPSTFFRDADGDRYGDNWVTVEAETAPPGYTAIAGDCNDADAQVNPGAKELCNNRDDNCNCQIDDNAVQSCPQATSECQQAACTNGVCVLMNLASGSQTCGAGACQVTTPKCVNGMPNVCTPNQAAASAEVCDGIDNDCNGSVDDGLPADLVANACPTATMLPGVIAGGATVTQTFTIYPALDEDWFAIPVEANVRFDPLRCSGFDSYTFEIYLTSPAPARYHMCAMSTCTGLPFSGQSATCHPVIIQIPWSVACNQRVSFVTYVRVLPQSNSNPASSCMPYTLKYRFFKVQ